MAKETPDPLLKEMQDIKMLMILQLISAGTKQGDISQMLGVSDATISRMIPKAVKASLKGKSNGE
jgi:DNA-binding transcriptional regulator LsrR (DeoR family)